MKGSKNRRGLILLKLYFLHVNKHEYWYIITRISTLKVFFFGFVIRSEHRIDILNAKSIGKEHLNVLITDPFIEKTFSFWDLVKKFKRSHQRWSIKKVVLFSTICLHHKWNGTRLLSLESEWTTCLMSCRTT